MAKRQEHQQVNSHVESHSLFPSKLHSHDFFCRCHSACLEYTVWSCELIPSWQNNESESSQAESIQSQTGWQWRLCCWWVFDFELYYSHLNTCYGISLEHHNSRGILWIKCPHLLQTLGRRVYNLCFWIDLLNYLSSKSIFLSSWSQLALTVDFVILLLNCLSHVVFLLLGFTPHIVAIPCFWVCKHIFLLLTHYARYHLNTLATWSYYKAIIINPTEIKCLLTQAWTFILRTQKSWREG